MGKGKGGIEGFERVLGLLSIETNGFEPVRLMVHKDHWKSPVAKESRARLNQ